MATYKVIQDVEAEDKLVGPLTLRQFIYAGISALCLYLSFLAYTKHAAFMLVIFLPIAGAAGFFAFPWSKDQPTEIWALAKLRFYIKPRRRIWDQSGTKELVTVTVPKLIEHHFTNGLNLDEVQSRLTALASTIDSRGWAIKNVNVNLSAQPAAGGYVSDRLINGGSFPQEVNSIDVRASDDILDETANPIAHQFDSMINASAVTKRQQLIRQMDTPAPTVLQDVPVPTLPLPSQASGQAQMQPADTFQSQSQRMSQLAPPRPSSSAQPQRPVAPPNYWFMQQPPTAPGQAQFLDAPIVAPGVADAAAGPHAANPTPEEEALVPIFKQENSSQTTAYGRLKTVKTPRQIAAEEAQARAAAAAAAAAKPAVTAEEEAAIINWSKNDDLSVAAIARQAKREVENDDGEVVISLR